MINGTSLFIGVESQGWTLRQFQDAARKAKALGISTLLVKIADGVNVWYDHIGGWEHVLETIEAQGILPVPYTYNYGDKFRGLQSEIAILKDVMSTEGIVVADMEAEWNDQVSWANTVANALKGHSGIFGVTTWADPNLQNWQGVLQALNPCVDVWMPQVYTDFLASVYKQQFAGLSVVPVFGLGTDFGSNDVVRHAKDAQSQAIALWEYQAAIGAYADIVKEIVGMSKVPAGWSDDGQTLRGPNNKPVVLGFRDFVLNNHWNADDWPLGPERGVNPVEQSNISLGGGTAQEFRMTRLCWTKTRGVYKSWIGQELKWYQDRRIT